MMIRVAPKIIDLERIVKMAEFSAYRRAGMVAIGIFAIGFLLMFVIGKFYNGRQD